MTIMTAISALGALNKVFKVDEKIEDYFTKEGDTPALKDITRQAEIEAKKKALDKVIDYKPFYKSKKWVAMVIGVLVPVINHYTSLGLDTVALTSIVGTIMTYIVTQGAVDLKKK